MDMLSNIVFCLNATIPIFLLMLLGMIFMKLNIFDDPFITKMNAFVFRITLPVMLFHDLCKENFEKVWDTRYVLFCFLATAASIALVSILSFFMKEKETQGEFIQASYRSSAAILGITLVENLYGNAGMTPLMIIGAVPLYNIMAVIILAFFKPKREPLNKELFKSTFKSVLKNPIIWGILVGLIWSVLKIPVPEILDRTTENIARLTTPLGVMAMGAAFDVKKALGNVKTAGLATFIKLIGLGLIFVPAAAALGFRADKLAAILIMCCSPTTVSCYVMAKNMDHEGTTSSSAVMLTTLLSAFTLTAWLFALKSFGLL